MSSPIPIRATQREADCRLRTVNHNIEKLAQSPHGANVCLVFASAAKLAGEAIQVAAELRSLHRADAAKFDAVIEFWHRVRDYCGSAALACGGGNQTLVEGLVAFLLLQNAKPDAQEVRHG